MVKKVTEQSQGLGPKIEFHVTRWRCHTWPLIFHEKAQQNDIGHVTLC